MLEDGRLEVGGRSGSLWWSKVVKIRDGLGVATMVGLVIV